MMDSTALTTLVDWWHPETHTFHLPCGEITMMLQDVTMILGLPIDGTPVSGTVSSVGWRDSVVAAIGLRPPDVPTDQKDRKTAYVHPRWLTAHFNTCPEDDDNGVVQRYARSVLCFVIPSEGSAWFLSSPDIVLAAHNADGRPQFFFR
jgi:hypothetical protein